MRRGLISIGPIKAANVDQSQYANTFTHILRHPDVHSHLLMAISRVNMVLITAYVSIIVMVSEIVSRG